MATTRKRERRKRGLTSRSNGLLPRSSTRMTSNVFCMFDQRQILEMKEIFNLVDQNCDGFIDKTDLLEMFDALGVTDITEEYVENMIKESPSYINLTMFLTLFGNKLNGTDPDDILVAAFKCLDSKGTGKMHAESLKKLLTENGERFSEEEMALMLDNVNLDKEGNFDYAEFVHFIKYGKK